MRKAYVYKAYGLLFSSELAIPELPEAEGTPDVFVKIGTVPSSLCCSGRSKLAFQAAPQEFLLRLKNIARFYVSEGREITVELQAGGKDKDVRLYLLGSVFGALLQQRGYLVLHGSSIEINGDGVLFAGESGIGKSTLAAGFQNRGYRILTDDVSAIDIDQEGIPYVLPGFPSLKLWKDAAERLGADVSGLSAVRTNVDKYRVDLEASFCNQAVRLQNVFILEKDSRSEIRIDEIEGPDKVESLISNTYRYHFLKGQGIKPVHFQQCVCVANQAVFYRVTRPQAGFMLDQLVSAIEDRIQTNQPVDRHIRATGMETIS
ncbi:MAG: hypothetical protein QM270_01455 [Bacillota bacterium]|nr:hypothetical protein [Bacillota bacterium]